MFLNFDSDRKFGSFRVLESYPMGMSQDFDVDVEKGIVNCDNVYTKSPVSPIKSGEETVGSLENNISPVQCGWGSNERKEKRKKSSASKPPRPPRGPSLDAADLKLIKEIAELAMLKRARIERMRALKKSREAKSASPDSSLGTLLASLFTLLFFFLLVLQGFSPKAAASSGKSDLIVAGKAGGDLVSVNYAGNPSASEPNRGYTGPGMAHRFPQNLLNPVSGLENEEKSSQ